MPKYTHTQNPVKGRNPIHKGWHAQALHERIHFRDIDFFRAWCHKSEGKVFAFPCQKHIYPLHHHSRTQTRGRSNIASLATFSIITFFLFVVDTLSGHFFICSSLMPRAWSAWYYRKEQAGREEWSFHANFAFTYSVEGGAVTERALPVVPVRVWRYIVTCQL